MHAPPHQTPPRHAYPETAASTRAGVTGTAGGAADPTTTRLNFLVSLFKSLAPS